MVPIGPWRASVRESIPRSESLRRIRILVADDHAVVRAGLKALIDEQPDLELVGAVADSHDLLAKAMESQAQIVVLDISMPGEGMTAALKELREQCPAVRTVLLTVHEDLAYVRHGLHAGASGYVLKRAAAEELVDALRIVASGGTYLDRSLRDFLRPRASRRGLPAPELSGREQEVLRWIALGHSNKEIASRLQISAKSVDTYKSRSMRKLGLKSRAETIQYALLNGWLREQGAEASSPESKAL
jgi:DNA-binding NarL/FixJ family response regulator